MTTAAHRATSRILELLSGTHSYYVYRTEIIENACTNRACYLKLLRVTPEVFGFRLLDHSRPSYSFPTEIKAIVASYVQSPADCARLRAVDTEWSSVATPLAFTKVYLKGPASWATHTDLAALHEEVVERTSALLCFLSCNDLCLSVHSVTMRQWVMGPDTPCWWLNILPNVTDVELEGFLRRGALHCVTLYPVFILPRNVQSLRISRCAFKSHSVFTLLSPGTQLLSLTLQCVDNASIIMPANYCHRRSKGNLLWLAEHGIGGAALHECRRDASAPSILTLELDCTCSASSSLLKVTDVGVRDFSSDLIDSLAATSIFYQNINYLMPVNLYFPSRIRVDLLLSLRLTIHDFQWPTVVQLLSGCRDLEDLDIVMITEQDRNIADRVRLPDLPSLQTVVFHVTYPNIAIPFLVLEGGLTSTDLHSVSIRVWGLDCDEVAHNFHLAFPHDSVSRLFNDTARNEGHALTCVIEVDYAQSSTDFCVACRAVFRRIVFTFNHLMFPLLPGLELSDDDV